MQTGPHRNRLRNALREYFQAALEAFPELAHGDAVGVLHPSGSGHAQRREGGELLPTRLGTVRCEAGRRGRLDVAPYRDERTLSRGRCGAGASVE